MRSAALFPIQRGNASGFIHDLYASESQGPLPGSAVYHDLKTEFDDLGIRLLRSDESYASVYHHRALRIYVDKVRTEAEFAAISSREADGWRSLTEFYRRTAPLFLPFFKIELPSAAMLKQMCKVATVGIEDAIRLARLIRQTSYAFAKTYFSSLEAQGLLEAWGHHLDFGPNVRGGAVFAFVASMGSYGPWDPPCRRYGSRRVAAAFPGDHPARLVGVLWRTRKHPSSISKVALCRPLFAHRGRNTVTDQHATTEIFERSPEALPSSFYSRVNKFRYSAGTSSVLPIPALRPTSLCMLKEADDLNRFSYLHINSTETEIERTYYQYALKASLPERPLSRREPGSLALILIIVRLAEERYAPVHRPERSLWTSKAIVRTPSRLRTGMTLRSPSPIGSSISSRSTRQIYEVALQRLRL